MMETTVIECLDCGRAFRIFGRDGTSIPYLEYCPNCGSREVVKEKCMYDPRDPDMDPNPSGVSKEEWDKFEKVDTPEGEPDNPYGSGE